MKALRSVIILLAALLLAPMAPAATFVGDAGCNFDAGSYTQVLEGATVGDESSSIDLDGTTGFYAAVAKPATTTAKIQVLWSFDDTTFTPGKQFAETNICVSRRARYVKFRVIGKAAHDGIDLHVANATGIVTTSSGGGTTITDTTYDRSITNTPKVQGPEADGAASASDPLQIAIVDGDGNVQVILGSTNGRFFNVPWIEGGAVPFGVSGPTAVWPTTPAQFLTLAQMYVPSDTQLFGGTAAASGAGAANTETQRIILASDSPLASDAATETTLAAIETAIALLGTEVTLAAIDTKLGGTLTVAGTVTANIGTVGTLALETSVDGLEALITSTNALLATIDTDTGSISASNTDIELNTDTSTAFDPPVVVSVGTSPTLIAAADTARREIHIQNAGTAAVFIGASGVATSDGMILAAGTGADDGLGTVVVIPNTSAWYGIVASGTVNVRVLEVKD